MRQSDRMSETFSNAWLVRYIVFLIICVYRLIYSTIKWRKRSINPTIWSKQQPSFDVIPKVRWCSTDARLPVMWSSSTTSVHTSPTISLVGTSNGKLTVNRYFATPSPMHAFFHRWQLLNCGRRWPPRLQSRLNSKTIDHRKQRPSRRLKGWRLNY